MLPRATTIDPLVAGLAVHPVRYEQGAYNQPMQDTAERDDETAPPAVDYPVPIPPTPIPFAIIATPDPNNPYEYSFNVTDDPNHHVDWDYGDGTTEEDVLCAETVEHTYDETGHYIVTAYCHSETIATEVVVAPGPGYGMGQYGIVQPYGGYTEVNPL